MASFRQISLSQTPRGLALPVALIDAQPEQLAQILSIKFERMRDDLDDLDGAALLSETGSYIGFVYHLNAPQKGIEVRISERAMNPRDELDQALQILAPIKPRLLWKHPALVER